MSHQSLKGEASQQLQLSFAIALAAVESVATVTAPASMLAASTITRNYAKVAKF